ncbi:Cro/Cl family transcriptional regulator [Salmonella enterica subsp. diarizonae serovar 16:z10:e,n,x,z15]|uniref:Cro/Cl family transcriptional regulator n=1 Tax=Salmonella enterica TaxID=28901 RepID=UPI00107D4706|nr:Cro/Cl family transcriptional regulator [Salmonella enterica subsp. diarizonae]EAY8151140.1 Cro/Cl family transcriptional regulator [Salmonella enterica]EDS4946888.1 Cro/Cl family transcriptional regulator [Salmonella enterica subsp. enterica serovar Redlands]MCH5484122.1 Cro/Cl family transcriptional regulator [Salmonella enterica subsp. diarizonae serovar 16:z10:e,n,x,z15]EBC7338553.1 Cro/Cl family transcriptional regulator [Salmonella enterica]
MKKKVLASALTFVLASGSAMAAVTTGQLTFNWQAVVPTAPVTSTAWAFVDGLDIPFVPGTEQLNIARTATGIKAVSLKPYDFFIVPVDTTSTITNGTPVKRDTTKPLLATKVFLGSMPVSNGLVGNKQLELSTTKDAVDGQIAINVNGKPLKVGSNAATSISLATDHEEHIVIDMNASIPNADVKDGASLSFVAPVIFAVDI